jgi:hypothetical protein
MKFEMNGSSEKATPSLAGEVRVVRRRLHMVEQLVDVVE